MNIDPFVDPFMTHAVREFLEHAFAHVGLNWQDYVAFDERYCRPAEVDLLIGDYGKAKQKLGWEPKTKFVDLVKLMVDADVNKVADRLAGKVKVMDQR